MDDIASAQSALYHIDAIERKLKLLRQLINPQTGTLNDSRLMAGLMLDVDQEIVDLRDDLVRLM